MEKRTVTGLVLRELRYQEADKILTLFTPDKGVISVMARNSLKPGGRLFGGTGLFCYSEFVLASGHNMETVREVSLIRSFSALSADLEKVALATYFAELDILLSPVGKEAEEVLRLTLNTLHFLQQGKHSTGLLKVIFELRLASLCGYMPQLVNCKGCGKYDGGAFYLREGDGALWCADCAAKNGKSPNLDPSALYALRHICLVEDKKVFAFSLAPESTRRLGRVGEQYLLHHLDRLPKSLEFYRSLQQSLAAPVPPGQADTVPET